MIIGRPTWGWKAVLTLATGAVVASTVSFATGSPYFASLLVTLTITLILTLSFNLLIGTAGLFCQCHSTFFGIGAYVSAWVSLGLGWSPWLAAPAAVAVGAAVGLLVGVPLLRLKGYFLATGSLAFLFFVEVLVRQSTELTGGAYGVHGLPPLTLFGHQLTGASYVPLAVVVALGTVVLLVNLGDSPLGRAIVATRDDSEAAAASGIETTRVKLVSFVLASGFAALAGWLHAFYFRSADPYLFSAELTFTWLFIVVIGGLGSIGGVAVSTVLLTILPQVLGFPNVQQILTLGILILIVIMFAPRGIAGLQWLPRAGARQRGRP